MNRRSLPKPSTPYKPRDKKPSRTYKPPDMTVEEWQVALRRQYGAEQDFEIKNTGDHPIFSDFSVHNPATEKTYRVAIRGEALGINYCSCPDFAVNTLGTCKHVEHVLSRLKANRRTAKGLMAGYRAPHSGVYLQYGARRRVMWAPGAEAPPALLRLASKYFDDDGVLRDDAFATFGDFLAKGSRYDHELRCYDDALAFISAVHDGEHRRTLVEKRYGTLEKRRALDSLLKVSLYEYQREGALFAVKAGRSLIADDMGLGKTVQAIAAAKILAADHGVESAIIVCPTSLKYQWMQEIEKFSDMSAVVIQGPSHVRRRQYEGDAFFKILSYETVHRDLDAIQAASPDLVILDEAQRIKNWKTVRARSVKRIQSDYAIVLTGTPLENRIEELHSIVEFVDRHRLGPLFQFLWKHQTVDEESGRVVGYRGLKSISETLSPVLLRRTKGQVLQQLPERIDKTFFVPMTKEQWGPHEDAKAIVGRIIQKWRKFKFLSEGDQRRLMAALQCMRMACDNTYLIDRETVFGPKLDEIQTLLSENLESPGTKVVIFSQFARMQNLVAQSLKDRGIPYVYLHGSLPAPQRRTIIRTFHEDPEMRIFLSTDAGGVGLNLQNASVVINIDLPWNPAVLDQRIGRVHRMGQHRPVRVVNFVSSGTIEHGLLYVLDFKRSLFAGVLDGGEDTVHMGESRFNRFMRLVEETTGAIPDKAHEPEIKRLEAEDREMVEDDDAREKPAPSPLQPLIESATAFLAQLGALVSQSRESAAAAADGGGAPRGTAPGRAAFIETDEKTGRSYLKLALPEPKVIEEIAAAAAPILKLLLPGGGGNRAK